MIRVATLMWGTAWERYGELFAKSFEQHWPAAVELVVVTDRALPLRRGRQITLQEVAGYASFKARWGQDRVANGYDTPEGTKVTETGYSWRHDAVKWMPQGLVPIAAAAGLADGDVLICLDADIETTATIPEGWVETILGDADVACLQRTGTHSEIGFHAERISPATVQFLDTFAYFYTSGDVFRLNQTHSAFVFDRALEVDPWLKVNNLNPSGKKGHVFPASPLGPYLRHDKGKRKDKR